jgi:putative transposon-encoded protein
MSKTRLKLEISNFEEIFTREVTTNGTGAHISLPRELLGEKVKIIVMKK